METLNDPTPLKSSCLNEAFDNYVESKDHADQMEVRHYIENAPALTSDEIRAKLNSCIDQLNGSENGVCIIVRNKLSNLLKNL